MADTASGKKYSTIARVLYHLVTFLEGFNLQCTPVCMRAFEMSLGLTASRLSVVFATELLSLLGIAAVWGVLIDMPGKKKGRKVNHVCSLGMLICGIACILIGCTSGFPLVLVCRFLHGAGLSCVGPVYSKIITEQWKKDQGSGNGNGDQTSTWFSVANGAHCAGKVLSLMLVSVLATGNVVGQYGWRLCYCLTGYVWLMVAVVVHFYMKKEGKGTDAGPSGSGSSTNKKPFYQTSTFWVMACVMYTSETPFVMLGYMVMYFQYSGLSNKMAGFVGAVIQVGAVAGSCTGGYAVDWCHKKLNEKKGHGRFTFAMSVLAFRLLCVTVLLWYPIEESGLTWHQYIILFAFGFTLFVASAVDRPTVSDIAEGNESLAGSLFRVAGGVPSSATISPIIALLAEKFGYIESKELLEDMDIQTRMANVNALRMSLICVGGVLTVLNILLYIPVFFTYENDKKGENGTNTGGDCNSTATTAPSSADAKASYPWYAIVLYHVFTFLDAYSTQSLYVCMGAFEVDLGISPSSLSIVAMAHMLSELALSPLWGYLVDNKESHYVECIAMLIMGITSILLGCTSCYPLILVLRFLHGASLGCTGPVIQKIITRSRCDSEQATWFGIYAAVYGLGSLIGCGTNSLLSMKNLIGLYGWRLSYCMLGYAWLLTAPLVFYFMKPNSNGSSVSEGDNDKKLLDKLRCIFIKKSYWLLVAVMFASEAAYAFMAYIPLYLQYSGLSEMAIACLCASVVFGGMFGGLFGGKLIDWCHEKSPEYGRLGFAVDALLIRLMYITILMWWPIPKSGLTWEHYVEAFIVGATLVTIHSVDRPMLDDVVPKGSEGTALSFLRMISGIPSSLFFPPLIANLAERVYGYVKGAGFGEGADRKVMASNANALRRSIMYIMIGATAVNVALYVGLFFTYKDDKDKATGGQEDGQSGGTQTTCGDADKKEAAGGSGLAYPWPSIVLYHMVSFINAYDTQILSLSMRALEASLGLSASSLSIMASMEGMTLMGFAPVWGYLVSKYPCQYVCAAGMALCGVSCILLAQVTTFSWILLIRLTHGIGLSCAAPVAVHIIAANWGGKKDVDTNPGNGNSGANNSSDDGTWSGINNGFVTLGKLACFFLTGRYAGQKVFGHSGWKLSYAVVGCVWLFAALPVCLYMTKNGENKNNSDDASTKLKETIQNSKFWVMTVVMFFSEAPYVIMGYMVMYLQYSGLSTVMIGSAIIVMQVGTAIGSVAGGWAANKVHDKLKGYGRLLMATCALLIRLMYFVVFLWWPLNEHGLTWHRYCLLFVIGLTMLVSPTIEKPIVSDLDKDAASMTVPLYRAIGGMPSYFVFMPLLGWMAEKMYGYVKPSGDVSQLGHMVMSVNANALRRSMIWILSIATVLNIGLYVVVYYADQLGDALKALSCPTTAASTGTGESSCPALSKAKPYPWYAVLLYHIAEFMEGYNMQCTPVCMRAFEMSLGVSASKLSFMYAVDLVSVLGIGAVWGYLLDTPLGKQKKKMEVQHVCCLGALVCGMGSILLGCTSSYPLILCSRFLQGGGLACVTQVCTKIIIEQWSMPPTKAQSCQKPASQTSLWFGLGFGVHCLGRVASLFLVGRISTWNVIGQYGWRLNYVLAGYVWLLLSVPVHFFMKKTITGAQHGSSSVDGAQFDPTNSSGRGEPQTAAVTANSNTGTTSMTATSSISIGSGGESQDEQCFWPWPWNCSLFQTMSEWLQKLQKLVAQVIAPVKWLLSLSTSNSEEAVAAFSGSSISDTASEAPTSAKNIATSAGTHGYISTSYLSCTSNSASNNGTDPTPSCKSGSRYSHISIHDSNDKKIPFYKKTTFWLMGLIMYTSEVPFVTMAFMVLYLQYCGLSDEMAGYVVALVQGSSVAGSFASGPAVDWCHAKSEDYGRLCFAMCVIALRLLCITLLLWWPIENGSLGLRHWASLSIIGCTFFVGAIIDRPTVADVAKGNESLAGSIFRLMGGIPSYATLSPTIAFLAERRFGYVKTNELVQDMHPATRLGNANALRMSMICVSGVISIANILLYIPVLYTYPADKGDRKMSVKVEAKTAVTAAAGTSPGCGDNSTKDAEPSVSYSPWAKVLYHVYVVIDAIDMEILPICMRAFEVSFGCSPATLSVVGAAEQAALLLVSPLWGYLLTIIKPYQVESAAMLVCGMMCILLGTTTNYRMLVLATLVHGATLGCTGPTHQKIITSSVKKDQRDMWYGIYTGVYYLAAMVSSILASRLSLRNVLGQYGWRLYYCVVGYMWLAAAVPTYYGMRPTKNGDSEGQSAGDKNNGSFWKGIGELFKKPSYYFMISLIYVSESCELFMGYIVIYLQYCGVRNQMAGFAISVVHMGNMIAGFVGGYAIQKIHCASKDYGKQLTGIGLIAIRLFAITLLLRKPFQGGDMRWYHYMCLALFGFAQLNRTSIDRTMLSDFVKEDDAAIALSLCRVIAGIPSNFTFPPLIGYLAERAFGYIKTDALVEDMDAFTKVTNATALSKSLLYIMGGSCLANMALYGGMMFTYKGDVVAKEKAAGGAGAAGASSGGGEGVASGGAATGKKEYELIAFILAAFVSFMDGFDTQILPSCMKVFEMDLGLTPSMLSVINSASFLSLLVASPLWGWLVDKYNCGYIQCIAMLLAGLTCVLHGYTSSYPVIVILTIFNGAGLACTAPIDQKIITANWPNESGVYFGISWTCYCLGRVASSTIGSRLIMRNIAGQYGWRMYCFLTGYIWIIASIVVHFYMKKNDISHSAVAGGSNGSSSGGTVTVTSITSTTTTTTTSSDGKGEQSAEGGKAKGDKASTNGQSDPSEDVILPTSPPSFYKVPTFWLLIPVKYASSAPLVILSYMVMYYQNSGLSDNMAGFAVGVVQVGSGIGGTGGGWVADQIHALERGYSRIGLAIGALVVRVLCVIVLLWSPLEGGSLVWYHYAGLFIMGLTLFTIQTVDKAMLGSVVSDKDQSTAISLVYFIAGIPSSSTLPTFVGYMAEKRFGYVVSKAADEPLHPVTMANNATALRKAMIYCMLIASVVNIIFYGATMATYITDVKAKEEKESYRVSACVNASVSDGSGTIGTTACAAISVHKSALNEGMITTASCADAHVSRTSESGDATDTTVSSCVALSNATGNVEITVDRSSKVETRSTSGAKGDFSVDAVTLHTPEGIAGFGEE